MADFATPTFQLVLEKQRREAQGPHLLSQEPSQGADAVVIVGARLESLSASLRLVGDEGQRLLCRNGGSHGR